MRDVPLDYIIIIIIKILHNITHQSCNRSLQITASFITASGQRFFSASDTLGRFSGVISEIFCKFGLSLTANE